jgi:hypothetical protein
MWHVLGRTAYRVLVWKREGKSPLVRPRLRWEDNIKVDVKGPSRSRGLRRRSAAARLLRSWVRIPSGSWMYVCCECCVLSEASVTS